MEAAGRISGVLAWSGFDGLEPIDRIRRLSEMIQAHFSSENRSRITLIVPFSPAEYAVYRREQTEGLGPPIKPTQSAHTNTAGEVKDPLTRLLDLTLAWGEYVDKETAEQGDSVKSEDIYAAYQAAAQFAEPYWDGGLEVQEMAVRHFMDTRILPLLLGKTKP